MTAQKQASKVLIRNALANLGSQFIQPLLAIVLVPFYLHYLGLEGYGLVGFFSMLITLLGIFSKGLRSAFLREVAKRDSSVEGRQSLWRLVRTFELSYWVIGIVVGIALAAFSGIISTDWIQVENILPITVRLCLILISLRIALSFPRGIYQSVFMGTQRQVLGNILNAISGLAGAVFGVVAVLIWQSVLGYYVVEVFTVGWTLLILRHWVVKILPDREVSLKASFDWGELKKLWRFSVGLMWVAGISLIVTQMDRIIISRLLPIATFGVYLAGVAGGRLLRIANIAFLSAVYPQLCQIAGEGHKARLSAHLIRNAKVSIIVSLTIGLPISFFSSEILELWTRNADVVRDGAAVMTIYIYGTIFLSWATVFYHGQLALGKSRFAVMFNTVALGWFPVTMWLLVKHLGLVGAAWTWVLYCIINWLFHLTVTLLILLEGVHLVGYLRVMILTTVPSVMFIYVAQHLAAHYFYSLIWGRVLMASIAAGVIFGFCYLICFGFHIPDELARSRSAKYNCTG